MSLLLLKGAPVARPLRATVPGVTMYAAGPARGVRGFEEREVQATLAANALPEDLLASRDLEALLDAIVEKYAAPMVTVHLDRKYVKTHEVHDPNDKTLLKPLQFEVHVPAEGEVGALFDVEPRALTSTYSSGDAHEVIFAFEFHPRAEFTSADLAQFFTEYATQLEANVSAANALIAEHRASLRDAARPLLEERWRRTRRLRGALEELSIPLSATAQRAAAIPLRPTTISMASLEAEAAGGAPEWRLAEGIADGVVQIISDFGLALERLPDTAARLLDGDEETLRDMLLFLLNANFRGTATGETFVGYGKSDILLRWESRDAFVGECKIWRGAAALAGGLDQLLTRYSLWRQSRVALILFIREPSDATAIIEKAHEAVRAHERTKTVLPSTEPSRRQDYTVVTSGDQRRPARLTLLPFVIPRSAGAEGSP